MISRCLHRTVRVTLRWTSFVGRWIRHQAFDQSACRTFACTLAPPSTLPAILTTTSNTVRWRAAVGKARNFRERAHNFEIFSILSNFPHLPLLSELFSGRDFNCLHDYGKLSCIYRKLAHIIRLCHWCAGLRLYCLHCATLPLYVF